MPGPITQQQLLDLATNAEFGRQQLTLHPERIDLEENSRNPHWLTGMRDCCTALLAIQNGHTAAYWLSQVNPATDTMPPTPNAQNATGGFSCDGTNTLTTPGSTSTPPTANALATPCCSTTPPSPNTSATG